MAFQVPDGYPPELTKYAKMLKFGIGEEAVRLKMVKDGFDESMFDEYLNPATAKSNENNGKNIFDNDSDNNDNDNENDNDEKQEEKQEIMDTTNNQTDNSATNNNNSNNKISKSEKMKIRNINYQTSLMDNPKQYGEGSFSQTNFVPTANSDLKLDTLQPVPVKKTLLIVNTFVVHTAAFLNKFVATCETKLHKIHTDITRMETTLNILEGKLNSINWLGDAESGNLPTVPNIANQQEVKESEFKDNIAPPPSGGANAASGDGNVQPEAPAPPAEDPVKSDPSLQPWFKMLKVGVPEQAVRNKMSGSVAADIIDRVIEIHRASKR